MPSHKAQSDEQLSHEEWEELPPLPPDGGWGWMVVAAALLCNIIVDGVCLSFGVFVVELQEYYGESVGKTAWVGSLIPGLYMTTGPLVSALCNKFSCQVVTIVGAVLASIFCFLSSFSPNLNTLIFLYGVMGGIGLGLMYLPSIVIVGFYFEKKRALATGLAVCGSGIGSIICPPIFQIFIDNYGWQGSFWIISGFLLNGVLCGALFRPLQSRRVRIKSSKIISYENIEVTIWDQSVPVRKFHEVTPHPEVGHKVERVRSEAAIFHELRPTEARRMRTVSEGYNYEEKDKNHLSASNSNSQHSLPSSVFVTKAARPLYREDIFFCGSLASIADYQPPQSTTQVVNTSYTPNLSSIPEEDVLETVVVETESFMTPLLEVLKNIFNFSVFKEVSFVLLCLGSVIASAGVLTPYVYLTALADENLGITPTKAAFLLSMLGISNTVGRVLFGWINDRPWADCVLIYNISPIACGIATCLVPIIRSYSILMIYCFVFGSFLSAFVTLRTIVLTQLYGIQRLSNTFGLLLLSQGIAALVGSPIAGMIYDSTNSYTASFVSSGVMLIVGGLISLPCRLVGKWQHNRNTNLAERSESVT